MHVCTRIAVEDSWENHVSCVALGQVPYGVPTDSEPYHQPCTSSLQKDTRYLQNSILLTLLRTVCL